MGIGLQDQEAFMKCAICRQGDTGLGHATVVLERGPSVVIVRDVPAQVCVNCGEYYLDEPVSAKVLAQAEDAANRRAEIEIIRYAA